MSAYEINCARYGREPDLPIAHFKEQCAQAIGSGLSPDAILDLRLRSFSDICTKLISENIITQFEFFPQYDETYHIDSNEPVPFRLTRNLQTFLTPFGVEGVYVAAFASAAGALAGGREKQVLQSQLLLYFHDEVLNWGCRRAPGEGEALPAGRQRPRPRGVQPQEPVPDGPHLAPLVLRGEYPPSTRAHSPNARARARTRN